MKTAQLTRTTKRATIYEVAKLANVSHVTVTRAFSDEASITPETRKKVLAAANELKYKPNALAKGLNGAMTHTIAAVWPMGYTFISEQAIARLVTSVQQKNYQIQLANTLNDLGMVKRVLDELLHRGIDAVVLNITPETYDTEVESLLRQFRAAVVISVEEIATECDLIIWDRTDAIRNVVDYLFSKGRRQLGYLAFSVWLASGGELIRHEQYKAEAFIRALEEHGLTGREKEIINAPERIEWDNVEAYRRFLEDNMFSSRFPFDGVLCVNDEWATITVSMLKKHGLRVPEDVAVVGYNDSRAALLCEPQLASVNRRNDDVVTMIEKLIFGRLENGEIAPQRKRVQMQFVWRESAG